VNANRPEDEDAREIFNGRELVGTCVAADDEAGWVITLDMKHLSLDGTHLVEQKRFGRVEIIKP
jgi:hypothetical protein